MIQWYSLLRKISIVGLVISSIIMVVGDVLYWWEANNPKNSHMPIEESSLASYLQIAIVGTVLSMVFGLLTVIT